jgi:hypothetical protein
VVDYLQTERPEEAMIYSIGHNIAGYLPESDAEWFADRAEAVARLADAMREYADRDDETEAEALPTDPQTAREHGYVVTEDGIDYGDDEPSMRAEVDAVLRDDGPDGFVEGPWAAHVLDGNLRVIAFWLREEPFDPEYAYVTLDGVRVEVEKVGGGTVGRAYEGTWRYVARDAHGDLVACGIDFQSRVPMKHARVAQEVLETVLEEG